MAAKRYNLSLQIFETQTCFPPADILIIVHILFVQYAWKLQTVLWWMLQVYVIVDILSLWEMNQLYNELHYVCCKVIIWIKSLKMIYHDS